MFSKMELLSVPRYILVCGELRTLHGWFSRSDIFSLMEAWLQ